MTDEPLYTTKQVAAALDITTGRVRQLARQYNLGRWVGSLRLFTAADIEVMRARNTTPGPRKEGQPCVTRD